MPRAAAEQHAPAFGPPAPSLVDPVAGLVRSVMMPPRHPGDPDVFIAASDVADTDAYRLPHPAPAEGSGAALTYEDAWRAAVGESIERYSLANVPYEDLVVGSAAEMRALGLEPVGHDRWALFEPGQLAGLPFAPFDDSTRIAWAPAQSLTHRRDCLVPASMVSIPYVRPSTSMDEQVVALAISTGAACAATAAEAMAKGACELIERDAFMIVWRGRLAVPRVRIDRASPLHAVFSEKFARRGLEYALFHTTLDLGIPSFAGVLIDRRTPGHSFIVGGAAHPNPERATLKTLLELVQGLKWKDYMTMPPEPEPGFANIRSFEDRAFLYAYRGIPEALSFLLDRQPALNLSDIRSLDQGEPRANLDMCIDLLSAQGLETIALDLTPVDVADCGLSVTRTMAPGLETMEGDHLAPFLGGKRWRETPVRLGLLTEAPTPDTMNPYPHPYP